MKRSHYVPLAPTLNRTISFESFQTVSYVLQVQGNISMVNKVVVLTQESLSMSLVAATILFSLVSSHAIRPSGLRR